ncbi:MAG: hypothetical protein Q7V12_04200, partial [Deltaproteobacteria bacterium]|nr:hypothetical protein [Deltaproteobacteria bacterium]
ACRRVNYIKGFRSWFDMACPEQTVRPFESLPGPTRPGTGRANGFFPNVLSKGEGRAHHKRIVK